ncbi:MAG: hypothetical protein ACI9J4_000264 [Paraglaciecola sp.]|jgi:hypothetical protein
MEMKYLSDTYFVTHQGGQMYLVKESLKIIIGKKRLQKIS